VSHDELHKYFALDVGLSELNGVDRSDSSRLYVHRLVDLELEVGLIRGVR
jgi:hypothetical protein